MLINARDPCQWTYLRNLPKKKKNLSINQCGEKGGGGQGGGDYLPVDLKISEPSVPGKKKKTLGINLGQPARKGREKKNPGINPGQPAGKGRKKIIIKKVLQPVGKGREKKQKNPGINHGQLVGKGQKKRRWRWNEL
jgi:hypothetical protein